MHFAFRAFIDGRNRGPGKVLSQFNPGGLKMNTSSGLRPFISDRIDAEERLTSAIGLAA